jgi:hypothetical protein
MNPPNSDALLRYDRARVKARKEDAEAYSAHFLAQFKEQLAKEYSFDSDATWKAAHTSVDEACEPARRDIAERCLENSHWIRSFVEQVAQEHQLIIAVWEPPSRGELRIPCYIHECLQ